MNKLIVIMTLLAYCVHSSAGKLELYDKNHVVFKTIDIHLDGLSERKGFSQMMCQNPKVGSTRYINENNRPMYSLDCEGLENGHI